MKVLVHGLMVTAYGSQCGTYETFCCAPVIDVISYSFDDAKGCAEGWTTSTCGGALTASWNEETGYSRSCTCGAGLSSDSGPLDNPGGWAFNCKTDICEIGITENTYMATGAGVEGYEYSGDLCDLNSAVDQVIGMGIILFVVILVVVLLLVGGIIALLAICFCKVTRKKPTVVQPEPVTKN